MAPVDAMSLLQNLILGVLFALVLSLTVKKFGRLMTDKSQYTLIFLTLVPTMVLIISVIKHSFALSLGLVGALSIVRFRTPIKEPEELVYLFLAIAVGLGLGADQVLPTTICFFFIVIILIAVSLVRRHSTLKGLFLDINAPDSSDHDAITTLSEVLDASRVGYELKRFVDGKDSVSATYYLQASSMAEVSALIAAIKSRFAAAEVALIDSSRQLS